MTSVSFNEDPSQLILTQLRNNLASPNTPHTYLQVDYIHRNILSFNPEEAQLYETPPEEENIKEYID